MSDVTSLTQNIIRANGLYDWLKDFPWLTGHLGDPHAAVWFVAENPSLAGVRGVDARFTDKSANLQWTCLPGTSSRLWRDAITEAGLKRGHPCDDEGWRCYITNADKELQQVTARNQKKNSSFMRQQAIRWLPVLQAEIDEGNPKVLVALGAQAEKLLRSHPSLH
jgi:uracil-DNA glycosylase